jgi:hypothetical protein
VSSSVCTLRPLIASFTNYKNNSSPFRHNWIITAQAASPAKENRETEDDEEEEQELPPAGGAAMNYFMDQGGTDAQADAMTAAGEQYAKYADSDSDEVFETSRPAVCPSFLVAART